MGVGRGLDAGLGVVTSKPRIEPRGFKTSVHVFLFNSVLSLRRHVNSGLKCH